MKKLLLLTAGSIYSAADISDVPEKTESFNQNTLTTVGLEVVGAVGITASQITKNTESAKNISEIEQLKIQNRKLEEDNKRISKDDKKSQETKILIETVKVKNIEIVEKEVPVEIIKEVIKEVPVEIIKTVEKEIIKEVQGKDPTINDELEKLRLENQNLKDVLNNAELEKQTLENETKTLEEEKKAQQKESNKEKEALEKEINSVKKEKETLKEAIKTIAEEKKVQQEESNKEKRVLEEEISSVSKENETLKETIKTLEEEKQELENEIKILEEKHLQEIQQLNNDIALLQQQNPKSNTSIISVNNNDMNEQKNTQSKIETSNVDMGGLSRVSYQSAISIYPEELEKDQRIKELENKLIKYETIIKKLNNGELNTELATQNLFALFKDENNQFSNNVLENSQEALINYNEISKIENILDNLEESDQTDMSNILAALDVDLLKELELQISELNALLIQQKTQIKNKDTQLQINTHEIKKLQNKIQLIEKENIILKEKNNKISLEMIDGMAEVVLSAIITEACQKKEEESFREYKRTNVFGDSDDQNIYDEAVENLESSLRNLYEAKQHLINENNENDNTEKESTKEQNLGKDIIKINETIKQKEDELQRLRELKYNQEYDLYTEMLTKLHNLQKENNSDKGDTGKSQEYSITTFNKEMSHIYNDIVTKINKETRAIYKAQWIDVMIESRINQNKVSQEERVLILNEIHEYLETNDEIIRYETMKEMEKKQRKNQYSEKNLIQEQMEKENTELKNECLKLTNVIKEYKRQQKYYEDLYFKDQEINRYDIDKKKNIQQDAKIECNNIDANEQNSTTAQKKTINSMKGDNITTIKKENDQRRVITTPNSLLDEVDQKIMIEIKALKGLNSQLEENKKFETREKQTINLASELLNKKHLEMQESYNKNLETLKSIIKEEKNSSEEIIKELNIKIKNLEKQIYNQQQETKQATLKVRYIENIGEINKDVEAYAIELEQEVEDRQKQLENLLIEIRELKAENARLLKNTQLIEKKIEPMQQLEKQISSLNRELEVLNQERESLLNENNLLIQKNKTLSCENQILYKNNEELITRITQMEAEITKQHRFHEEKIAKHQDTYKTHQEIWKSTMQILEVEIKQLKEEKQSDTIQNTTITKKDNNTLQMITPENFIALNTTPFSEELQSPLSTGDANVTIKESLKDYDHINKYQMITPKKSITLNEIPFSEELQSPLLSTFNQANTTQPISILDVFDSINNPWRFKTNFLTANQGSMSLDAITKTPVKNYNSTQKEDEDSAFKNRLNFIV